MNYHLPHNGKEMKQIRNEIDDNFAQPKAESLKLRYTIKKLKSAFIRLIRVVRVPILFITRSDISQSQ